MQNQNQAKIHVIKRQNKFVFDRQRRALFSQTSLSDCVFLQTVETTPSSTTHPIFAHTRAHTHTHTRAHTHLAGSCSPPAVDADDDAPPDPAGGRDDDGVVDEAAVLRPEEPPWTEDEDDDDEEDEEDEEAAAAAAAAAALADGILACGGA